MLELCLAQFGAESSSGGFNHEGLGPQGLESRGFLCTLQEESYGEDKTIR